MLGGGSGHLGKGSLGVFSAGWRVWASLVLGGFLGILGGDSGHL